MINIYFFVALNEFDIGTGRSKTVLKVNVLIIVIFKSLTQDLIKVNGLLFVEKSSQKLLYWADWTRPGKINDFQKFRSCICIVYSVYTKIICRYCVYDFEKCAEFTSTGYSLFCNKKSSKKVRDCHHDQYHHVSENLRKCIFTVQPTVVILYIF